MTVLANLNLQPCRESINNRRTNAVQTAGNLIAAATELAASMQNGIYNSDCGKTSLLLYTDRDTASIILYVDDITRQDLYIDAVAVAGKRFVDRIIHDLVDEVVQAAWTGGTDVHTRAFPDSFQTFENLDLVRAVIRIHMCHFINIHGYFSFLSTGVTLLYSIP